MALLDDVRVSLRVTSTMTDVEVSGLIAAAIADMRRVGVRDGLLAEEGMDPLAKAAVLLFCKANYGFDNSESAMYFERYKWAVRALMNSSANVCDDSGDESSGGDSSTPSDDESGDEP